MKTRSPIDASPVANVDTHTQRAGLEVCGDDSAGVVVSRCRVKLTLLVILGALSIVVILHAPLLRSVAWLLIVDQSPASADSVLILAGNEGHKKASEMLAAGETRRVLVLEDGPSNLVRFGIVEPSHEKTLRRLVEYGVPKEAITVIQHRAGRSEPPLGWLSDWLTKNPDSRLCVLTGRFGSRQVRLAYNDLLTSKQAARVCVVGLPGRQFDETNWWKFRNGIKAVVGEYLALLHARSLGGRHNPGVDYWDALEYEEQLKSETSCIP